MRPLLLVQKEQRVVLDQFYTAIERYANAETRRLSSDEQANLKNTFKSIDSDAYSHIILFIRTKKELKQLNFIKTIPNLVIIEHDATQNYLNNSKYKGKFSKYYRTVPWVRVFCSGYNVTRKLQAEGFDAVFLPKGYDHTRLMNTHTPRGIELGFLGSIESKVYSERKKLLESLQSQEKLSIQRTHSGQEYLEALNNIKFFISADVGLGEYMIKNFEAMACGCVLFCWDQGESENSALGLIDMHNVVLYKNITELKTKLHQLRTNDKLANAIAEQGQQHAENHFTWDDAAKSLSEELKRPLRKRVIHSFLGIKRYSTPEI